jgi:nickel-dependent lactate racemase
MGCQTFQVPCGKETLALQVPEGVEVREVKSNPLPPVPDAVAELARAIRNPIGSPRLAEVVRQGQTVAIVVTDITRKLPEDLILQMLLDELQRGGVRRQDVKVVVATGTHRPNTRAELEEMFGAELVDSLEFVNHDAWDGSRLTHLGYSKRGIPVVANSVVAAADVKISTGVIETHLFAGYSGGVKSIAVGVAGEDTIGATHNYDMLSQTRLGVIEGNLFREFLTEATEAVGLDFIVNVVQTGEKKLVRAVAGDPVAAFLEGVKTARALYEVELDAPGDIVVAGVSYPKSRDLYQGARAANTTVFGPQPVVKKGGVILLPMQCEDGFGHPGFVEWMAGMAGPDEIIEDARVSGFAPGEQKALILAWILKHARLVITNCTIPADEIRRIHLDSRPTLQQALDEELARRPGARVVVIPDGLLTLPVIAG